MLNFICPYFHKHSGLAKLKLTVSTLCAVCNVIHYPGADSDEDTDEEKEDEASSAVSAPPSSYSARRLTFAPITGAPPRLKRSNATANLLAEPSSELTAKEKTTKKMRWSENEALLRDLHPRDGTVCSKYNPALLKPRHGEIFRPSSLPTIEPLKNPHVQLQTQLEPKLPLTSEISNPSTSPLIEILSLPIQQDPEFNYETAIDKLIPELTTFAGENYRIAIITKIIEDLKTELLAIRPNVRKNKLAAIHTALKADYFLLKARWFTKQPNLQCAVKPFRAIDDVKFMADEQQIEQVFANLTQVLSFKDGRLSGINRIASLLRSMHALDFSLRLLLDEKNLQNFNDMSRAVWMFDILDILFTLASRLNKIIATDAKNLPAHKYLLIAYFLKFKIISHYHKHLLFRTLGLQRFMAQFLVMLKFISAELIKIEPRLTLQQMSATVQEYISWEPLKPQP